MSRLRSLCLSESTKAAYKVHLKTYLKFCETIQLCPIPATDETLCRFIAYLSRSRAASTVRQYLNIVRIISLEFGLSRPLDTWQIKSMMKGLQRDKGGHVASKAPITVEHLSKLYEHLHMDDIQDIQFWAACLTGFFGLLRVSNFTVYSPGKSLLCVSRQDLVFSSKGLILNIKRSKTNQFKNRPHEVVLPYFKDNTLCPTTAITHLLSKNVTCGSSFAIVHNTRCSRRDCIPHSSAVPQKASCISL